MEYLETLEAVNDRYRQVPTCWSCSFAKPIEGRGSDYFRCKIADYWVVPANGTCDRHVAKPVSLSPTCSQWRPLGVQEAVEVKSNE